MTPRQHELLEAARRGEIRWLTHSANHDDAVSRTAYFWITQPRELRSVTSYVRRMINNGSLKECRVLGLPSGMGLVRPNDGTFSTGIGVDDGTD